jgi:hypothetical protein
MRIRMFVTVAEKDVEHANTACSLHSVTTDGIRHTSVCLCQPFGQSVLLIWYIHNPSVSALRRGAFSTIVNVLSRNCVCMGVWVSVGVGVGVSGPHA